MIRTLAALCSVLALSACATTAPAAGPAVASAADSGGLIDRYDAAAIESVAKELGLLVVSKAGAEDDGGPNIRLSSAKGGEFGAFGVSCSGKDAAHKCDGIQFVASFDAPADADETATYLDEVNASFSVVKMVQLENRLSLSRYLIMDNGISRGNLLVNLQIFEEVLGYVVEAFPG
jgi:hypothetical protein